MAQVLSISDAVKLASDVLKGCGSITIMGEITSYKGPNARSGHHYFALKDEMGSCLNVVVWKGIFDAWSKAIGGGEGVLANGVTLQMTGKFQVYAPSGQMSFVASAISVAGEGVMRQRIEALARKLEAEGLMSDARKRKIPLFCERVAVVTSLSGDAIEDVKRTLKRRNPLVHLMLFGCQVQGATAPATIIRALEAAASYRPDCILLVRGGGSAEDLMCFNDEALARCVAASPVPVVTGIGHERDTSICDMVADRRTSTPSTAAESTAPALSEILEAQNNRAKRLASVMAKMLEVHSLTLDVAQSSLVRSVQGILKDKRVHLDALAARPCLSSPEGLLESQKIALSFTEDRLHAAFDRSFETTEMHATKTFERFDQLGSGLTQRFATQYETLLKDLEISLRGFCSPYAAQLGTYAATLDALSPLKVLGRGYSIARTLEGHVIESASQLSPGDSIALTFRQGKAICEVKDTEDDSQKG